MTSHTPDRLGIEFISALGMAPPAFVAMASRLGCAAIGLAPAPITGPLPGEPLWSLRGNPTLLRETKQALADHGVRLSIGEGLLILPGAAIAPAEADVALMAELGAPLLNVCVIEPDLPRAADQFAALAAMAAAHGLPVTVEFMPHTPIGTLTQALALVEAAGAPNAGVLVDAMHLFGSGGSAEELAAAPPARIAYAQLCDTRQAGFYASYFDDARYNRLAPGAGVLPLEAFLRALPAGCPVGLELPMMARAEAGAAIDAMLHPAIAAARALLAPITA